MGPSPPTDRLDLKAMREQLNRVEPAVESLKGKSVIAPLGFTGAGKSTFGLYCLLPKAKMIKRADGRMDFKDPVPDDFKFAKMATNDARSETLHLATHPFGKRLFLDLPGLDDTRGIAVEVANMVITHRVFTECATALPVIVVDFRIVRPIKGAGFRQQLDWVDGLFGGVKKSRTSMMFVFNHIPDDLTRESLASTLRDLLENPDESNTRSSAAMIEVILDNLEADSNDDDYEKVQLFRPMKSEPRPKDFIRIMQDLDGLKGGPQLTTLKISESVMNRIILELKMVEEELPALLENGNTDEILSNIFLFQEIGKYIEPFAESLQRCSSFLSEIATQRETRAKDAIKTIQKHKLYIQQQVDAVNDFRALLLRLEPLHDQMTQQPLPVAELDCMVLQTFQVMVNSMKQEVDFERVAGLISAFHELVENFTLDPDTTGAKKLMKEARTTVVDKISKAKAPLADFSFDALQKISPDDYTSVLSEVSASLHNLTAAEEHLGGYLDDESGLVAACTAQLTADFQDLRTTALAAIEAIDAYTNVESLRRSVSIAKSACGNRELLAFLPEEAQTQFIEIRNAAIARGKAVMEDETKAEEDKLSIVDKLVSLHSEVAEELRPVLQKRHAQLASGLEDVLSALQKDLQEKPPNIRAIAQGISQLQTSQWMDEISGTATVAKKIERAVSSVGYLLTAASSKIMRNFARRNLDGTMDQINDLDALEPLKQFPEIAENVEAIEQNLALRIEKSLEDTVKSFQELTNLQFYISCIRARAYIADLQCLCDLLGLQIQRDTTAALVDQEMRAAVAKLLAEVKDPKVPFPEKTAVLDEIKALTELEGWPSEHARIYQDACRAFRSILLQIQTDFTSALEDNSEARIAAELLKQYSSARIASEHFPAVQATIDEMHLRLKEQVSNAHDSMVPLVLRGRLQQAESDFQLIPNKARNDMFWACWEELRDQVASATTTLENMSGALSYIEPRQFSAPILTLKLTKTNLRFMNKRSGTRKDSALFLDTAGGDSSGDEGYVPLGQPERKSSVPRAEPLFRGDDIKVAGEREQYEAAFIATMELLDSILTAHIRRASADFAAGRWKEAEIQFERYVTVSKKMKPEELPCTTAAIKSYHATAGKCIGKFDSAEEVYTDLNTVSKALESLRELQESGHPEYGTRYETFSQSVRDNWTTFLAQIDESDTPTAVRLVKDAKTRLKVSPGCEEELSAWLRSEVAAREQNLDEGQRQFSLKVDEALLSHNTEELGALVRQGAQENNRYAVSAIDAHFKQLQNKMQHYTTLQHLSEIVSISTFLNQLRTSAPDIKVPIIESLVPMDQLRTTLVARLGAASSQWENPHGNVLVEMLDIATIAVDVPGLLEDTLLQSSLLRPLVKNLRRLEEQITKGEKQYNFPMLAHALDMAKRLDPILTNVKTSVLGQKFPELLLDINKAQDYATLVTRISLLLEKMDAELMDMWNRGEYSDVIRSLAHESAMEKLKSHIPSVTVTRETVLANIKGVYTKHVNAALQALQEDDMTAFSEPYSIVVKASGLATCLQDTSGEQLIKQFNEKLMDIEKQIGTDSKPSDASMCILELQEISAAVPERQQKIDEATNRILAKLPDEVINELSERLTESGNLGGDVVSRMPRFSKVRQAMFVAKTQTQDIDYALANMKVPDDPNAGIFSMMKSFLSGSIQQQRKEQYEELVEEFESIRSKMCPTFDFKKVQREAMKFAKNTRHSVKLLARVLAVWSYSVGGGSGSAGAISAHPVQVLTLLTLIQSNGTPEHNLVQVPTGEGKSVILGCLSVVYALQGYGVSCICYSDYLSKRDYGAFEQTFKILGVDHLIQYSTITNMSAQMVDSKGCVRSMTQQLMKGEKIQGDAAKQVSAKGQILLIDEVDVLLSGEFYGKTYNPVLVLKGPQSYELMKLIWSNRDSITAEQVFNSPEFAALTQATPGWDELFRAHIHQMVSHAAQWNDNLPTARDDLVWYPINGASVSDVKFGYKTYFAYFHFHETGQISELTLKETVGVMVKCGHFSYAQIPTLYTAIVGVTGTLSTLSEQEKHLVARYGIRRISLAPSVYGVSKRNVEPPHVIQDPQQWQLEINQVAKRHADAERAVLIICPTPEAAVAMQKAIAATVNECQLLIEDTEHKDNIIRLASKRGMITICSRVFARGTDFVCNDKKTRSAGGVHVIMTFVAECEAELVQAQGRTARQGDPGTYQEILLAKDLAAQLGFEAEELPQIIADNGPAQLLLNKRDTKYEDYVQTLVLLAQKAETRHTVTNTFQTVLLKNDPKARDLLMQLNRSSSGGIVPNYIVFNLDDSGSMSGKPWKDLIAAVANFEQNRIQLCNAAGATAKDLVTIVNYSNTARTMCKNVPITKSPHSKTKFRSGGTDFAVGLNAAQVELQAMPSGYSPVLVFMSDGGCGNGDAQMRQIKSSIPNVKVMVVGFTPCCNQTRLQKLAELGGGTYYYGADAASLLTEFETMSADLDGGASY